MVEGRHSDTVPLKASINLWSPRRRFTFVCSQLNKFDITRGCYGRLKPATVGYETMNKPPNTPSKAPSRRKSVIAALFLFIIRGYQRFISPLLPASCRYAPTCSDYAVQAIRKHGGLKGGWLATTRILRCHPWGGCGFDAVPETLEKRWWLGRRNVQPNQGSNDLHEHESHN